MPQLLKLVYLSAITFVLIGCKTQKQPVVTQPSTQQEKKKDTIQTSHSAYNASKTRKFDLLHTKLEVSFDWNKQYLNGLAELKLTPYFYSQNVLELDAKGMDIQKVELLGKSAHELKYLYDKKLLQITLDKTYDKSDTLSVAIKYVAKPNELPKGGSAAITEDKGLYFINPDGADTSKPRQIWTQGETEASSAWFPTIDATNERCTQEMYITVDTAFKVLSNGEMVYTKNNSNGTKTEYWKMDLPHAPYLFMMAVGDFAIVEDNMPKSAFDWKNLELKYYVEPKYKRYAKNIFGNTPEMIDFFSKTLSYKFPWQKYSQIVVRDYVSGAMENTSAVVFMESLQVDDRELLDEHWDGIIAHELFHHWFGDLVTCESWANLPLNESFANYSEYLWAEYKYGVDEADHLAEKEKAEYYDEAQRKQEPLIRYHYKDREDMFDRHSYNKGGRVLHMLRKQVGDKAFFAALSLYLHRHQFKSVEIHDFRLAFEEVTGEDLNWFFNQWFLAPGHAQVLASHTYSNGQVKLTLNQLQDSLTTPVYTLPMPVDVWTGDKKTRSLITFSKNVKEITLPSATKPDLVVFDPEHQLLGTILHTKTRQEYIFQYEHGERYLVRKEALERLFFVDKKDLKGKENPNFNDPLVQNILSKALEDPFWEIRDFAMSQFSLYLIPNIENYLKKIEAIALNDIKPSVRAKAIYLLSSYNNKAYTYIYEKGITDRAYSVAGASLSAYLKSGDPLAQQKLNEFLPIDNINIVIPLADYFIESKDVSKYSWFKAKMNTGNAQKLYNMLAFFGQYLSLVSPSEKEDGKKILQKISKENKYDVIKQMAEIYLQMVK